MDADLLDIRTLILLNTFISITAAAAIGLLWRSYPEEDALRMWALGALLTAAGYLGIALRGWVPPFVSIPLANVCITVGHACFLRGTDKLVGKKPLSWPPIAALGITVLLFLSYFAFIHESTAVRMAFQFVVLSLLSLATARRLLSAGDTEDRLPYRAAAAVFLIFTAALWIRVGLMASHVPGQDLFGSNTVHAVVFVVFVLFYTALMYCFPALLFAKDTARRKQVEHALRNAEARYRLLFEHSPYGVLLLDTETGKTIEANPTTYGQLGYTREEFARLRISDYEVVESPEETKKHLEKILREGSDDFETLQRKKNGEVRHVHVWARSLQIDDRTLIYSTYEDITERRLAERKYQNILETALDGFWAVDSAGRLLEVNNAYCRMSGYNRDELLGMTVPEFESVEQPEETRKHIEKVIQQGSDRFETRHRRKDGTVFDVEISAHYSSEQGGVFVSFLKDITERKQAEQAIRRANASLETRVQERTAALEVAKNAAESASRAKSEFLSRMSHELRTPLNAILGFGQLLDTDTQRPLAPEQRDNMREILHAGRHLLDLINEVLDLARIETGRIELALEPVAVLPLATECLTLLQPLADTHQIELASDLDQTCVVQADRLRLRQILLNLLSNGIKYNRQAGSVRLICRETPQGRARITVRDSGRGIAAETLPRLFQPFERLESAYNGIEGTGIGLALAKHLTEAMGGAIGVDSVAGAGSTFWVELPLASPIT